MSKVYLPSLNAAPPKRRQYLPSDDGYDTGGGYLDSREFASFAASVASAIAKLDNESSIGQIKQQMGTRLRESWLMDACDALISAGAIESVQRGSLTKYRTRTTAVDDGVRDYYRNYNNRSNIE